MGQALTGALSVLSGIVSQAINSTGNAPTLLMLDSFCFSINTAAFKQLDRDSSYRWAAIEQFGTDDALQFTSVGEDTISLPCCVYPGWRGGSNNVDNLRTMARAGQPYRLITGAGNVLGYWVITKIRESQSFHNPDGSFRKQEFTLEIRYFGPSISN